MSALGVSRSTDLPPAGEITRLSELWAWTLAIALLGSWTCFAEVPGVNWALWTIAAAAGFLRVNRRTGHSNSDRYPRTALALASLLSIAAAVTASPVADAMIFLAVVGLFAFSVLSLLTHPDEIGPSALARAPLDVCRALFVEAAARIADTLAALRMREAVPVIRGSTMALGLAATLFLLLSAADPTMAGWQEAAWQAILSWRFLARDVFFVMLAILLLGGYGLAARHAQPIALTSGSIAGSPPTTGVRFSGLERLIVLGAALALFATFFGAELASAFASGVYLSPGETFAEATHRGFGEMIAAAVLCALVIMALDRHALRNGKEAIIRLVSGGVIAASLAVIASAYLRARYYETAYGYTELRLYVQVCCAAVSVALLLLAWELRSAINIPRLLRHVALAALVCIAGLCYWNSAAWIVKANVARYQVTGKLDVDYLERLARSSPDAIPALLDALPHLAPSDAQEVRKSLEHTTLDRSILALSAGTRLSWYDWSLRRAAARSALRNARLADAATG